MKSKPNMTPGVVGTALAAVAAGSLVLFSLVLQGSAFDASFTDGLKALSPSESAEGISVQAAPEANDSAGDGTTVAETPPSTDSAGPSTATDSFSPVPDDGDVISLTVDNPSDDEGDFPEASGGTGNKVDTGGIGRTVKVDGPQATISKDPNGRPGDVELPDRNGPKNTAPPHGNPGSDDDDRDQADGDRDKPKNDKSKNKSPGRPTSDESRSPGESNNGSSDRDRRSSRDGDRDDPEAEDRNDRHDTRKDSDEDDDWDDDDDDRDDDSDHGDDDSRGHSGTRGHRP